MVLARAGVQLTTVDRATSRAPGGASVLPGCRSANTRVWYGLPGDGAAGHIFYQLQFSNIGHSACTFFGYPGVSALDIHGHQVGKPATHTGAKLPLTLAPGTTAHLGLEVPTASAVRS